MIVNSIGMPTIEDELLLIYEYAQGGLYLGLEKNTSKIDIIKIKFNGGSENE